MGTSETFGRYELIKLVGAGGMALVHLARQRGPEGFVKPCVLKRIAPDAERFDQVRQMFLEEARITALLNHPNIVQVFDYGVVDVTP
ncbi:MAG: serine/threonine protein kinase, partial [Myxococcota bacterium]